MDWPDQLPHKQCKAVVQVLHRIFIYNILPAINQSVLNDDTTYLIDGYLNNAQIDLPAILCHTMIRVHEVTHSTGSLPYPTIITQLLQVVNMPFKVAPQGWKANKAVGHDTLWKMGVLDWPLGLRAEPSRANQDTIRTSALSLLYTLVRKVTKVLKNQKTLASNQK